MGKCMSKPTVDSLAAALNKPVSVNYHEDVPEQKSDRSSLKLLFNQEKEMNTATTTIEEDHLKAIPEEDDGTFVSLMTFEPANETNEGPGEPENAVESCEVTQEDANAQMKATPEYGSPEAPEMVDTYVDAEEQLEERAADLNEVSEVEKPGGI